MSFGTKLAQMQQRFHLHRLIQPWFVLNGRRTFLISGTISEICTKKMVHFANICDVTDDVTDEVDQRATCHIAAIYPGNPYQKENPRYMVQEKSYSSYEMCAKRALAQVSV